MPAQLVALDYGPSILLDKPILLLGRHPECDIQIDSRKISRRHCCIAQVSDYLVVRDLGSTNGIRINGVRIVEGRLAADDELTIGNYRYKVSWDPVLAPAASPASPQPVSPPVKAPRDDAAARKHTVREPSPVAGIEDEMLESCDEPVALDEPGGEVGPISPPPSSSDPSSSPPSAKDKPVLLPDQLELMPNSKLFGKNAPPPPSPSGIHST
jgi:predicted component of type VI protein secretion system